jgi:alkanesulfonate monooxygenase SsuD/methylene tetrahydromethanopterin reductase-like flavin-dependent oxidoreductase (luciferase family)
VAAVPSAVVEDPATAFASMRRDLLTYFGLPFYRAMLERSGFGEDIAAYDEAAARGDGEAMQAAISERFLRALCAIGSPEEVRAGVARYGEAGANAPCVGPIARTDFEATLRAAAPA